MNYLLFILLASFWGGSYVAIKFVVALVPPFFSAALRVGLSAFFLWLIFRLSKKNIRLPMNIRWKVWVVGLFTIGIPFAFVFYGERFVTAGLTGIVGSTVPLWAFALTLIFYRDAQPFSLQKLLGLIIGMLGVVFVFWPSLGTADAKQSIIGGLAITAMAISYAIGALLTQHLLSAKNKEKISFYANVFHQNISAFVFLFLISLLFEHWPHYSIFAHNHSLWIGFLYLSLFSTAIAWIIYFYLIQEEGAVKTSSVAYLIPVMTLLWDFLFFHNVPKLFEIYGIVTILAGVMMIQLAGKKNNLIKVKNT
jgi:drug/metabolite transporter (DMT)-like permease